MEAVGNLKSLTTDELTSVIKNWPWFGAARRELCERMSKMGGSEWGKEQYADAAMYIASRTIVSDIVRSSRKEDYSDKDVQTLLKRFIAPEPRPVSEALSGVGCWAYSFFTHLQAIDIAGSYGIVYLITTVVSGTLVAGLLMWFLYVGIAKTGALDKFASGREVRGLN